MLHERSARWNVRFIQRAIIGTLVLHHFSLTHSIQLRRSCIFCLLLPGYSATTPAGQQGQFSAKHVHGAAVCSMHALAAEWDENLHRLIRPSGVAETGSHRSLLP